MPMIGAINDDALPNIGGVATIKVDGLVIRCARGGAARGTPVLLTAPWPESIYAFRRVIPRLGDKHPFIAVDLPGFGHSESRDAVMGPQAMGDFAIKLLDHFQITRAHAITPDVGTPAVLFAAAKKPDLFESLMVGDAAAQPGLAAGVLKDLIHSPAGAFASVDGVEAVNRYLDDAARLTPGPIIEDFKGASAGRRFEDAVQYVRRYISDLPKLATLLPAIKTPVLIIAGRNDALVPPANGQFLADRLPRNRYVLLEAGHRVWEEAASDYADHLIGWIDGGYNLNEKRAR
jgi:pimeloyl-ACP methyl ester carboxylesterase